MAELQARRRPSSLYGARKTLAAARKLFDIDYYLRNNPDVADNEPDPFDHYLRTGWAEGRNPSPLFDNDYYLSRHADVAKAGHNPLLHYVAHGAREGRSPSPLFAVEWYTKNNADVCENNPVLLHYITTGAVNGRAPNPLFDTEWYARQAELDPAALPRALAHYIEFGARLGLSPHPLFDPQWYIRNHPDAAGKEPLSHYLAKLGEHRSAHPLFDVQWYRATYADVAATNADPLIHYVELGAREGRQPNALFDPAFYRRQAPDASAASNPLAHYVAKGARDGLRPSTLFDSEWYVEQYPEAAQAGANPLIHYFVEGKQKGYLTRPNAEAATPKPSITDDRNSTFKDQAVAKAAKVAEVESHAPAKATPPIAASPPHQLKAPAAGGANPGATAATRQPPKGTRDRAWFNSGEYFALRQEVQNSGFWDETWYLSQYYEQFIASKKARANELYFPLDHYLQEGWTLGHTPSRLLPVQVDEKKVGCSKIEHFLNRLRFESYQFDENIWIPSEERIADYLRQKRDRRSKRVVYTCILQGYDTLMQPYFVSNEWDYVCFTDDLNLISHGHIGVWDIRPIMEARANAIRTNRWHKMHPHLLFPDHDESIYVDGNVNVISDYLYREIQERDQPILLPQHFLRTCIYQEIDILLGRKATSEVDKALLTSHKQFLVRERFPANYGLSENNVIYRRHHDSAIASLMTNWWDVYDAYSTRDQASLAYVFWKNGLELRKHVFPNTRVKYRDFWVMKHLPDLPTQPALEPSAQANVAKQPSSHALEPAFAHDNIAVVFSTNEAFIPYLGVAVFSLIENARSSSNYDIIILAKGLPEHLFAKVLELARNRPNVSIRVHDTSSLLQTLPEGVFHVEGYVPVETYNKCFITEILSSKFERCAYLDSDILVLADVKELHDIDLQGCSIGASVNVANVNAAFCKKEIKGRKFNEYLENELGVRDFNQYFQAGVVVLDMNRLRKMNLRQRTIETLRKVKQPIFFDQCIFNSIFYGDVHFFSTRWNHVWYMQQYSYLRGSIKDEVFFDYAKGRVDPKIIHYAGKDKPQGKLGWVLSDLFWKYAYSSPFLADIQKDIATKGNEVARVLAANPTSSWYAVKPRLLVHVHLFYRDQLDFMLKALGNVTGCEVDLFVTMVESDKMAEQRILAEWPNAHVIVLPNVGYDIYPFLHVLKHVRLANYDFILKVHTKNARAPGQEEVYGIRVPGYRWRDELINALAGSKRIFESNLARLQEDKGLGCIGAQEFIFSTENNNEERNYKLADWRKRCGVSSGTHYVGGSMFFARAYPFERLRGLNMQAKDFEAPSMSTKDWKNLAHIFERLLGIVVEAEGFSITGPAQSIAPASATRGIS